MALRDVVWGRDPVRVVEKSGSRGVRKWERIATRLVHVRDRAIISGVLLPFDHDTADALLAVLRGARAKTISKGWKTRGSDVQAQYAGQEAGGADLALEAAAPLFTQHWLAAALESLKLRERPLVVNGAGEPLEFVTMHFPLAPGVTQAVVRDALAALLGLRRRMRASGTGWRNRACPGRRAAGRRRSSWSPRWTMAPWCSATWR